MRARDVRLLAAGALGAAAAWPLLPHPFLPCPLRATTGVPCPLCGVTRAVVEAAHGHLAASLRYNPLGIVLVALALVFVLRPRPPGRVPLWPLAVGVGLLWAYNVGLNPTFA